MNLPPKFDHVFHLLPNPSLILLADAPKFTIVAVNNAVLLATDSTEKDFIGKGIFEAFLENREEGTLKDHDNFRNSLNFVIAKRDSHKIPLQKYMIPIRGNTKFKTKYANIQNIPIKDDNKHHPYFAIG